MVEQDELWCVWMQERQVCADPDVAQVYVVAAAGSGIVGHIRCPGHSSATSCKTIKEEQRGIATEHYRVTVKSAPPAAA